MAVVKGKTKLILHLASFYSRKTHISQVRQKPEKKVKRYGLMEELVSIFG